ncbi:MAG: hypothetical protein ACXABO_14450 [Promethearchaeota archaeon]
MVSFLLFELNIGKDKNSETKVSERYQLDWKDLGRNYYTFATRYITSNSTITNRVFSQGIIIQKDLDNDGLINRELTFEFLASSTEISTITNETTHLHFKPTFRAPNANEHDAYLTEIRNATTIYSDSAVTFKFTDFNNEQDIKSIRFYRDLFPNEVSETYDIENILQLTTNDQGDQNPANDITVASPDLEELASLTHPRDGISAIYDQQIVYENKKVKHFNILAKNKSILIPGGINAVTNFNSATNKENITLSTIAVKPKEGVLYDLNTRYGSKRVEGTYYYCDINNVGKYSTIFVTDSSDEVINIGFDYDDDNILNPGKQQPVEKHIIYYEPSGWMKNGHYVAESYKDYKLVYIQDYDHYDGVFYEYQFGDAMFDVWKMQYSEGSSKLIEEQMAITSNQFIQSITPSKIREDIAWQVKAQIGAAIVGGILSAIVGAITGGSGSTTAFKLGYMITYAIENAVHGWIEHRDQEYYINSQTFHNENYDGPITLSERTKMDEYYGDVMTQALLGSRCATYAPVKIETAKHLYQGKLVLAPGDLDKTDYFRNLDITFKHLTLDYSLQSRNYLMYTDFDDPRLEAFYFEPKAGYFSDIDPQLKYMEHSLMYLEQEVNYAAVKNNDATQLNTVVPYMVYGQGTFVPVLEFADSGNDNAVIPEFYVDYPIFVSSEQYKSGLMDEYYSIYKVYDLNTESIKMLPEDSVHTLQAAILSCEAILVDTLGNQVNLGKFYSGFTIDKKSSFLVFNQSRESLFKGKIKAQKTTYSEIQNYDAYIIFEFHIEKYRDIANLGDLTAEDVNRIATAQSAQASILEFVYQHTIATETQQKLSEIAYTLIVTAASTALTAGVTKVWTIVSEMFQEIAIDPWIEAWATNFMEDLGGDTFAQLLFSGFAEGAREAFFGSVSSSLQTSIGINTQTQTSRNLESTNKNAIQKIHDKVNSIKDSIRNSRFSKGLSTIISSVAMFSGIGLGGMDLVFTTLAFKTVSEVNAKILKKFYVRGFINNLIREKEKHKDQKTDSSNIVSNSVKALIIENLEEIIHDQMSSLTDNSKPLTPDSHYIKPETILIKSKAKKQKRLENSIESLMNIYQIIDETILESERRVLKDYYLKHHAEYIGMTEAELNSVLNKVIYNKNLLSKARSKFRKDMDPYEYISWKLNHNNKYPDKYAEGFDRIKIHIRKLGDKKFRTPLDRNKIVSVRVMKAYELLCAQQENRLTIRIFTIYAIVQKRDFRGKLIPLPPFEVGYQTSPTSLSRILDDHRNNEKLSVLLDGNFGGIYFALKRFLHLKKRGVFISKTANLNDYFEVIPIDFAHDKETGLILERFYQMYLNREENLRGYDLNKNYRFNAIVGDKTTKLTDWTKFITKDDLDFAISLGLRKHDLQWWFDIGSRAIDELLIINYPGKKWDQIHIDVITQHLHTLIDSGVKYNELNNFFFKGKLKAKVIKSRNFATLNDVIRTQTVSYSDRQIDELVMKCIGGEAEYNRLLIDSFYKPILLKLYQEGAITKGSLIDAYKTGNPFGPLTDFKSTTSIESRMFGWVFELVFKTELTRILAQPKYNKQTNIISIEIVKDLNVYNPNNKKFNGAFKMYVQRIIKKMFGTTNHQEIYILLKSGVL